MERFAFFSVLPFTMGTTHFLGGGGTRLKAAVTVSSASVVIEQVPVPVQAPDQPAKLEPAAGVAVRVTAVPYR